LTVIFFTPVISAVLAVGLAAILGYMAGHRAGSRATRELFQSGRDCRKHKAGARGPVDRADEFERGLADAISAEFAMMIRYREGFSIVVFDIDNIEQMGQAQSDRALQYIDRQLAEAVRETDAVVRHGGNRFFVLMPRTDMMGACEFGERFREALEDGSSVTVSGGITTALDGDSPGIMVIRVNEALESAKQSEGNCIFRHDGRQVEPVLELVLMGNSDGDNARG
jgi:diguanylate cyclase (GGDEF)-like protein